MSEITFVYFDIGGVLFNWRKGLTKLSEHLNRSEEEVFEVFSKYDEDVCRGVITPNHLWEYFKSELNVEVEMDEFIEWWTDTFTPIKPMHELVHLVSKKYRVGLLTNIYSGAFIRNISKGHVPNISYDTIIQSCELNLIKPEKEIFIHAQEKARVKPSEIFYIDDSDKNIEMAKSLGWNAFLFNEENTTKLVEEIKYKLGLI